MGEQHLEGFGGNVRRFPGHAIIGDSSSVPRTVLPQIAEANRSLAAAASDAADPAGATSPNIMDQTLGPSPPPMERFGFKLLWTPLVLLEYMAWQKFFLGFASLPLVVLC